MFYTVMLKPVLFVADTPARYSVLNWTSFNGYFGCCYCYNEGQRNEKTHFYPNVRSKMRTVCEYTANVEFIKKHPSLKNWKGVKGVSALSQIVPNLPLSMPLDYMHQIALGVARTVLDLAAKEIKGARKEELKRVIKNLNVSCLFFQWYLQSCFPFFLNQILIRYLMKLNAPLEVSAISPTSKQANARTGFSILGLFFCNSTSVLRATKDLCV